MVSKPSDKETNKPSKQSEEDSSSPKTHKLSGLVIGVAFLLFGAWLIFSTVQNAKLSSVSINGNRIVISVARTPEEQQQGLSGLTSLAEDEGMLFVYDTPGYRNFWMKDMNFSIDIIWIDADGKIVDITKSLAPETYPETFTSIEPAKYILEVNSGYSDAKSINIGDRAIINI